MKDSSPFVCKHISLLIQARLRASLHSTGEAPVCVVQSQISKAAERPLLHAITTISLCRSFQDPPREGVVAEIAEITSRTSLLNPEAVVQRYRRNRRKQRSFEAQGSASCLGASTGQGCECNLAVFQVASPLMVVQTQTRSYFHVIFCGEVIIS